MQCFDQDVVVKHPAICGTCASSYDEYGYRVDGRLFMLVGCKRCAEESRKALQKKDVPTLRVVWHDMKFCEIRDFLRRKDPGNSLIVSCKEFLSNGIDIMPSSITFYGYCERREFLKIAQDLYNASVNLIFYAKKFSGDDKNLFNFPPYKSLFLSLHTS